MELQVGHRYTWKGVTSKLVSRWAQGAWNTYTFEDGRSFHGDPAPLVKSGEITEADPIPQQLPATKMRPEIVPTPSWLLKKKDDGKTSKP